MIAPCNCRGTQKYVHRDCLDEWRAQEQVARAFTHCPTCKFEYEVEDRDEHRTSRLMKFRCLMLRDTCALFVAIQFTLSAIAFVLHCLDGGGRIPELYPKGWARRQAAVHFAIGPYYCSAVILSLALLGLLGVWLKYTGRLPAPPVRPAARHRVDTTCCPCCPSHCDPIGCYFIDCEPCCRAIWFCPSEGAACECGACVDSCGACDLASAGGEGAAVLLPIVLVIVLVFAVIGLFVGAFFSMVLFQRALQRHVHLLQMRSEAQRWVVVNRAWREPARDGGTMMDAAKAREMESSACCSCTTIAHPRGGCATPSASSTMHRGGGGGGGGGGPQSSGGGARAGQHHSTELQCPGPARDV